MVQAEARVFSVAALYDKSKFAVELVHRAPSEEVLGMLIYLEHVDTFCLRSQISSVLFAFPFFSVPFCPHVAS